MKAAGFSARELRVAEYSAEQLQEACFSSEAIKLAGYVKVFWSFGGRTWTSLLGGEDDDGSFSRAYTDADTETVTRRRSADGKFTSDDTDTDWIGPTFEEWGALIAGKRQHKKQCVLPMCTDAGFGSFSTWTLTLRSRMAVALLALAGDPTSITFPWVELQESGVTMHKQALMTHE